MAKTKEELEAEALAAEELEASNTSTDEDLEDDLSKDILLDKLRDTRTEAKKRRLDGIKKQTRIDELEAAERTRAEDKLKEDGKISELLDTTTTERDSFKTKAEKYDEYVESKIEEAKTELGDDWNDEYASLSLTSINKLVKTFKTRKLEVDTDDGTGKTKVKVDLSDDEKTKALEMFPGSDKKEAYEYFQEIKNSRKKKE